jgi:hypothetical protein
VGDYGASRTKELGDSKELHQVNDLLTMICSEFPS